MTDGEGRAGQEAARLVAVAQDWLRTAAPHLAPVGIDGEPCSCPLCRAVVGLRDADPDTIGRWVDAAVVGVTTAVSQAAAAASDLAAQHSEWTGGDEATDDARPHDPERAEPDDSWPAGVEVGVEDRAVRRIPLDGDLGPDIP